MKYDTARPYAASFVIIRRDGKIAFVLRSNTSWMNGYYGLPSGKVEKQESFTQAAIREAQEEIGITIEPAHMRNVLTMYRDENDNNDGMTWVDIIFECDRWEGEPYNAEPDRHSELVWLDPLDLPKNVLPTICYALEQIAAGKSYAEYGW